MDRARVGWALLVLATVGLALVAWASPPEERLKVVGGLLIALAVLGVELVIRAPGADRPDDESPRTSTRPSITIRSTRLRWIVRVLVAAAVAAVLFLLFMRNESEVPACRDERTLRRLDADVPRILTGMSIRWGQSISDVEARYGPQRRTGPSGCKTKVLQTFSPVPNSGVPLRETDAFMHFDAEGELFQIMLRLKRQRTTTTEQFIARLEDILGRPCEEGAGSKRVWRWRGQEVLVVANLGTMTATHEERGTRYKEALRLACPPSR